MRVFNSRRKCLYQTPANGSLKSHPSLREVMIKSFLWLRLSKFVASATLKRNARMKGRIRYNSETRPFDVDLDGTLEMLANDTEFGVPSHSICAIRT